MKQFRLLPMLLAAAVCLSCGGEAEAVVVMWLRRRL